MEEKQKTFILALNVGSTSIKSRVFCFLKGQEKEVFSFEKSNLGPNQNHQKAFEELFLKLDEKNLTGQIKAIGHRVVHGGKIKESSIVNEKVVKTIKKNEELAPLHNPFNLAGIRVCQKKWPKTIRQVAVFDTGFFRTIPDFASTYPIPIELTEKYGIERFGFHGISHQNAMLEAAKILKKPEKKLKIISVHLGGGSSITAISNGKAVDTSMGFTPLEGLVMGTRSGDIDPGIIFYLAKKMKKNLLQIQDILVKKSGIFGLSKAKNMLELIREVENNQPLSKLSFEIFIYRVQKYIGAYLAVLGRCDALVFTGTVGSGKPITRQKIIAPLKKTLLKKTRILSVKSNEEKIIAKETYKIMKSNFSNF